MLVRWVLLALLLAAAEAGIVSEKRGPFMVERDVMGAEQELSEVKRAEVEAAELEEDEEEERTQRALAALPDSLLEPLQEVRSLQAVDDFLNEVEETRELETRKGPTYFNPKICVFCDASCQESLTAKGKDPETFLDQAVDVVQKNFKALPKKKYNFKVELFLSMLPSKHVPLETFEETQYGGDTGFPADSKERLAELIRRFWMHKIPGLNGQSIYDISFGKGCDADLLILDDNDAVFDDVTIDGVAPIAQICKKSYAGVKLSTSYKVIGTVMTHEIGHLLGMYHDGPFVKAYADKEAKYKSLSKGLAKKIDMAKKWCKKNTNKKKKQDWGCTAGGGTCLMSGGALNSGVKKWSKCSVRYFELYRELTKIGMFKKFYSFKCLQKEMNIRSLDEEEGEEQVRGIHVEEDEDEEKREDDAATDLVLTGVGKRQDGGVLTAADIADMVGGLGKRDEITASDVLEMIKTKRSAEQEERELLQSLVSKMEEMLDAKELDAEEAE